MGAKGTGKPLHYFVLYVTMNHKKCSNWINDGQWLLLMAQASTWIEYGTELCLHGLCSENDSDSVGISKELSLKF